MRLHRGKEFLQNTHYLNKIILNSHSFRKKRVLKHAKTIYTTLGDKVRTVFSQRYRNRTLKKLTQTKLSSVKKETPENRYRYSRQRERLLEILRSTASHPTATWLYDRLKPEFPNLSLGTVYRNLAILINQTLVHKIDAGSTFDRFEAKTAPHYHLICRKCGNITDFEKHLFHEIDDEIRRTTDFAIEGHRIDFFGTCAECRGKS
jgi:Fur family transcriptional regulator, peroxide stress response regulator